MADEELTALFSGDTSAEISVKMFAERGLGWDGFGSRNFATGGLIRKINNPRLGSTATYRTWNQRPYR